MFTRKLRFRLSSRHIFGAGTSKSDSTTSSDVGNNDWQQNVDEFVKLTIAEEHFY